MKNSEYQAIVDCINDQIEECKKALSEYNTCLRDFSKMTMENINTTIVTCRKLQQFMDRFAQGDLYHIIGMGNLNAAQTSHIVKLTKTLFEYRSDVKFFAYQNTIKIPERKEKAIYKLSSGISLVSKNGD